jgi:hypothetical protein
LLKTKNKEQNNLVTKMKFSAEVETESKLYQVRDTSFTFIKSKKKYS